MPLQPRVLDLIAYLVERHGQLVTKQELLRELWGDRFVSDGVLTSCVYEARQALGEGDGAERLIQTVHGRGYRFGAPVETIDDGEPPREVGDARTETEEAIARKTEHAAELPTPIPVRERGARRANLTRSAMLGIVLVILLIAAAVVVWRRDSAWSNPLEGAQFSRLTNFEESEFDASVSADGKFAVFLADRDGPVDAWVTQIGTGEFENLTTGRFPFLASENTRNVGFTRDGSHVWAVSTDGQGGLDDWLIPTTGGTARRFVAQGTSMAWSPDGSMLAYLGSTPGDPIFIADRDAGNPRRIFVEEPDHHCHYPTWSPDGRYIYFVRGVMETRETDVWRVAVSGGEPERITRHRTWVVSPTPLDNRILLYAALADDGSGPWLYAIDVEERVPHRIGLGVERYTSISATADGRRLVASVANPTGHLLRLPILDHPAEEMDAVRVPIPNVRAYRPRNGPDYLLYVASRGGPDGLWKFANGVARELWKRGEGGVMSSPAISSDGRQVSLTVASQSQGRLYVMNADGTGVRTIGAALNVSGAPSWSPDGKWIVVAADSGEGPRIFKVPLDGGTPLQLTNEFASNPVWSPDGRLVVYSGPTVGLQERLKAITPEGTPAPFPDARMRVTGERHRFTPDGKGLVLVRGDWKTLDFYLLDLGSGRVRRLSSLEPGFTMRSFDLSPDGKHIFFDRVSDNADVVLIDLKAE